MVWFDSFRTSWWNWMTVIKTRDNYTAATGKLRHGNDRYRIGYMVTYHELPIRFWHCTRVCNFIPSLLGLWWSQASSVHFPIIHLREISLSKKVWHTWDSGGGRQVRLVLEHWLLNWNGNHNIKWLEVGQEQEELLFPVIHLVWKEVPRSQQAPLLPRLSFPFNI